MGRPEGLHRQSGAELDYRLSGNFVGALLTALIMMGTQQYMFSKGLVGLTALNTAMTKVSYNPVQAFCPGRHV